MNSSEHAEFVSTCECCTQSTNAVTTLLYTGAISSHTLWSKSPLGPPSKTWKIIDYLMAFLVGGLLSTCERCGEYEGGWKRTNCHSVLSESKKKPYHFKLSLIAQNDREEIIDCMKMSLKNMYHSPLFTYYTAICRRAFSLLNLAECRDGSSQRTFHEITTENS